MNIAPLSGWKDRLKRSREKQQARDDAADVRAARVALYAEQAAEGERRAAEDAAKMRAERITCPCCAGEGRVTVELAERVYRAFERLSSDSKPDPHVMATLARIARGEAVHGWGPKVSEGLSQPAPLPVETSLSTAQTGKNARSAKILAAADTLPGDGALIEP